MIDTAEIEIDPTPQRVYIAGGSYWAPTGVVRVTSPRRAPFDLSQAFQAANQVGSSSLLRVDYLEESGLVVEWDDIRAEKVRWTFEAPSPIDEYEAPEADPAEADPAEVEPGMLFNLKHYFPNGGTIGDGLVKAGNSNPPKVVRYTAAEVAETKARMEAHNPGHTFQIVTDACPIHGASCTVWNEF